MHQRLLGLLVIAALMLGACSQLAPATPTPATATLSPILAVSELAVGPNRVALGVIKNGSPINSPDLQVHLRVFELSTPDATVKNEADAVYRGQGLPFGLYVANLPFETAGDWGLEVQMTEPGRPREVRRLKITVLPKASTPAVGDRAFPSKNLTIRDVPDLTKLTSDGQADPDLYQLTIADAIAAKRPFLVAFSTPGFCQTAVCSPNLNVIKELKPEFQKRVNFLHVEVFPYPFSDSFKNQQLVPAMAEWNLTSEPWTFLVDSQGIIQAKYEGGITLTELEPALTHLANGKPITPLP